MRTSRWVARTAASLFTLALLYPFTALFTPIGPWKWGGQVRDSALASIRVSLLLTGLALILVVAIGTPLALYIERCQRNERLFWQAVLLLSILLPPLALGILLALAFRPDALVGHWLWQMHVATTNSRAAFVVTQVYVSIGYYVLGAVAAFSAVPRSLEKQSALLGLRRWQIFMRVTFPLSRLGLAAALSVAWVRAIGEFGAVVVTAYYPAGMPVQLWVDLESFGLPAVMPLLVAFLLAALPLPWILHVAAQRGGRA
jgi:molybdate/tungstate transport system permease protein